MCASASQRVTCPSRTLALMAAGHTGKSGPRRGLSQGRRRVTVYVYEFAHLDLPCDAGWETQMLPWWVKRSSLNGSGWASHGSDVRFVFGTTHGPGESRHHNQPTPVRSPWFAGADTGSTGHWAQLEGSLEQ